MTPRIPFMTFIWLALMIIMISSMTYAYASANTVPQNTSGDGTGTISGYVVTNVSYHMAVDPRKIASVSFTLSGFARNVKIRLSNTQTDWYVCTNLGSNDWSCDTQSATVLSANELRVMASSN